MQKYSRLCKEMMVDELAKKFESSPNIIVTQAQGITVQEIDEFKKTLSDSDVDYFVVKNSICKIALKKSKIEGLDHLFSGPVAFSVKTDGPVAASKAIVDFAKKNNAFNILGGMIDGEVVDKKQLEHIASLPSKDVLIAMILSQFNAPISQFVSVLSNTLSGLVYALNEIKNNKEKGEDNGG